MITSLLVALIVIAIICVVAGAIIRIVPMPAPVGTIIWAVVAIVCLFVLLRAITGGSISL